MFNWICPECGRDNAPSATECPFCAERKRLQQLAAQKTSEPAMYIPLPRGSFTQQAQQSPEAAAPQAAYPPQAEPQPVPPPKPQPAPPPKPAMPTWLLGTLFALGFMVLFAAIFLGYQFYSKGAKGLALPVAAARTKPKNLLQKYVEVVGIRLVQDPRKHMVAKFIVVNHATAELDPMNVNVNLWASTSRSEEDAIGSFTFKLPPLAPNESRELTVPLTTKLKVYELPDWQNAITDVEVVP